MSSAANLVLAQVVEADRHRVARFMEPVDLPVGTVIVSEGKSNGVYFPVAGLVSVVVNMSDGTAVECAALGREGWIGAETFSGLDASNITALQQIPGGGLRMQPADFHAMRLEVPSFGDAVLRFNNLLLRVALQAGACNRLHDVTARCARWLLFCAERVGRNEFPLTQQFLAEMLGASRSAVGATLLKLESDGVLSGRRGQIVIMDPARLQNAACECHEVLRAAYDSYANGA